MTPVTTKETRYWLLLSSKGAKFMKKIILIVLAVVLVAGGIYAYQTYQSIQTASAAQASLKTARSSWAACRLPSAPRGRYVPARLLLSTGKLPASSRPFQSKLAIWSPQIRNWPRWSRPPCRKLSSWLKPIYLAPSRRWTTWLLRQRAPGSKLCRTSSPTSKR